VTRGLSISACEKERCIAQESVKMLKLPGLRQWKNALREHPDDEFFGFAESNSFYLTDAQGRVKTPTPKPYWP
jgi:hypothetical protein